MINVLQAMILTDKEKMLLTPTYHVFEMYKVHQDATFLPVDLQTPNYAQGGESIPAVSASASRDKAGAVHLSLVNCDPNRPMPVSCKLTGVTPKTVKGRILTADTMQAHNTFDNPTAVQPAAFTAFKADGESLTVELPAKSVVVLELL
jgi:alpha-N-arabinofuranosidase